MPWTVILPPGVWWKCIWLGCSEVIISCECDLIILQCDTFFSCPLSLHILHIFSLFLKPGRWHFLWHVGYFSVSSCRAWDVSSVICAVSPEGEQTSTSNGALSAGVGSEVLSMLKFSLLCSRMTSPTLYIRTFWTLFKLFSCFMFATSMTRLPQAGAIRW